MELATFRKTRGLTQEELAIELGLAGKSYISGIESGALPIPLRLALRIERWSEGEMRAIDLVRGEDAELLTWVLDRHAALAGAPA